MSDSDSMQAMVISAFKAPRPARVPVPKFGPSDVLLRVRATGVGLTVVIMTANPGRVTSFPRIPGQVVELGGDVSHVKIGDRVACYFHLTCRTCRLCRAGPRRSAPRSTVTSAWRPPAATPNTWRSPPPT